MGRIPIEHGVRPSFLQPFLLLFRLTEERPASPVLLDGVKGGNMMKPPCRKALPLGVGSFASFG